MKTHILESRPLQTPAFIKYKEALRAAQEHPDQVERARLYRRAGAEMYPESAATYADYESHLPGRYVPSAIVQPWDPEANYERSKQTKGK